MGSTRDSFSDLAYLLDFDLLEPDLTLTITKQEETREQDVATIDSVAKSDVIPRESLYDSP